MPVQNPVNKLQITKRRWTNGDIDMNSLQYALQTKPYMFDAILRLQDEKYLTDFLLRGNQNIASSTSYQMIGNEKYQWRMMRSTPAAEVIHSLVSPLDNAGVGLFVGRNHSEFRIAFEDANLDTGDIVRFGTSGNEIHARVQSSAEYMDGAYVYRMQLVTDNANDFIDPSFLTPGTRVAAVSNAFEEASEGGTSRAPSFDVFENILTIQRAKMDITGSALTEVAAYQFTVDGEKIEYWCYWQEHLMIQRFKRAIEYWRIWGNKNESPSGKFFLRGDNARVVKTGAGLLAQIAHSHTFTYNNLNEDFIGRVLNTIQMNAQTDANTTLVLVTGIGGKELLNKALRDAMKASPAIDVKDLLFTRVDKENITYNPNFFTGYRGLLGTNLVIVHNPMMDNKEFFPDLDPTTGYTRESYRMLVLNMGDFGGEPNISLIAKGGNGNDRSFVHRYVNGMMDYNGGGGAGPKAAANTKDAVSVALLSETGLKLTNPYSCAQLIRQYN